MNREQGFTIIELMIAVGLTAILLGMAAPAVTTLVSNARQTGAINDLVSSMHLARSTAITTNTRVTMCASGGSDNCAVSGWDQGWIVFTDRDSDRIVDADEDIISSSDGSASLTIQSASFPLFLMYRPNGRVMNAAINGNIGEFTVCDTRGATHAKVLVIDLSGRPRTSTKLANGAAPSCI